MKDYIEQRNKEFDEEYHYQEGVELLLKSPNHFQTYDVTKGIKHFQTQTLIGFLEKQNEELEGEKIKGYGIALNDLEKGHNSCIQDIINRNKALIEELKAKDN